MYSENDYRYYLAHGKWTWPNGNNSKEYNHDYYSKHKDKWKEYNLARKLGVGYKSAIDEENRKAAGYDARANRAQDAADRLREAGRQDKLHENLIRNTPDATKEERAGQKRVHEKNQKFLNENMAQKNGRMHTEEASKAQKPVTLEKKPTKVGDLPEREKKQVYKAVARHLNEELANRESQKNAQMSVARSKGKFDDDFMKQVRNNPKQKDKKWMEDEYSKYLDKKYLINETRQGIIDLGGTVQRPASARVYSDWNDLREELEKNYG